MEDWAEVPRLFHREGLTKTAIARRLAMSRTTVIRLLALKEPPQYRRPIAGSLLDPYRDEIAALLAADPTVPATVFRERLERLSRIPLLIVDEVGYIPFDPEAAALFFALISSRDERRSLIVSSNKTFSAWAEIFGDPVAVAAMVDRLVHHAEVIVLKGESYRLRGKREEVLTGEKER